MNTPLLLKLAALTYLGLLAAGALLPGVVGLRRHLSTLPRFIRQLFWVYYTFIGLSLVCFGLGTWLFADELAAGTPLARAVCVFLALFWTVRLVAGTFVFDLRPYLTNRWRRVGLAAANIVFACLPFIYGWAAITAQAEPLTAPTAPRASISGSSASGEQVYTTYCAVCHGPDGKGIDGTAPALAGSDWVLADSPARLIRIVLGGMEGPVMVGGHEFKGPPAPPMRDVLNDAEIAGVLTHIRRRKDWGHAAPPVSEAQVSVVREATRTRDALWTAHELLEVPERE